MYIGFSLLLVVVGAVMRWAVNYESEVFNIQLAGLIIFIVGIVGLVVSLFFWFTRRGDHVDEFGDRHPHDYPPV